MSWLKKKNISQSFESILIMERIKVAAVAFIQKLYLDGIELLLSLLVVRTHRQAAVLGMAHARSTLLMVGSHNLALLSKCLC